MHITHAHTEQSTRAHTKIIPVHETSHTREEHCAQQYTHHQTLPAHYCCTRTTYSAPTSSRIYFPNFYAHTNHTVCRTHIQLIQFAAGSTTLGPVSDMHDRTNINPPSTKTKTMLVLRASTVHGYGYPSNHASTVSPVAPIATLLIGNFPLSSPCWDPGIVRHPPSTHH